MTINMATQPYLRPPCFVDGFTYTLRACSINLFFKCIGVD
jgi:hypothetical protein